MNDENNQSNLKYWIVGSICFVLSLPFGGLIIFPFALSVWLTFALWKTILDIFKGEDDSRIALLIKLLGGIEFEANTPEEMEKLRLKLRGADLLGTLLLLIAPVILVWIIMSTLGGAYSSAISINPLL